MTKRTLWSRRTLLLAALMLPNVGSVQAQPVGQADMRAVRAVVEAQLAAFAADDAERAFGFATPALRAQFGNAATFMAMVRQGYPMVIRPAATVFFVPLLHERGVLQPVRLRDADGQLWLASYELVKAADGSWRIAGCTVVTDTDARAT